MIWREKNHRIAGVMALLMAVSLPLAGCNGDDDPVAPPPEEPQLGTFEMAVRDNPPPTEGAAHASAEGAVEGQFHADARVQVFQDGDWADVTGLTNLDVSTELQAGEEVFGTATAEARTYDRVRIVLTNARAEIEAGSEIGAGPIGANITVAIAAGEEVVVEHTVPVTLAVNGTTRVVLVLNSNTWLTEQAAESQTVGQAEFQNAVAIEIVS